MFFNFVPVNEATVYKLLSTLSDQPRKDVICMDCKSLQISAAIITPSLTAVINVLLSKGFVLYDWKVAKVTPAYKGKGDVLDKTNYRQLSVVAHISKVLDKIIQVQVMDYLESHAFLTNDQSAYLKRHSTQTCLHRLVDYILENRNNSEITGLCFLDILKYFDTIDYTIRLDKMYHCGFKNTELMLFKSYLSQRKQVVSYNGVTSSTKVVSIGVPQGTVIGPMLFLLYLNDLSTAVNNACINIYSDDVVLYISDKSIDVLSRKLQCTLQTVFNWYNDNKLDLRCNGIILQQRDCFKYIGIVIYNQFKWERRINEVAKRITFNNARLRMLRNILPRNVLIKIFNATSIPIIDYASSVWDGFSTTLGSRIKRLETAAARAITGNYDFINVRGDTLFNDLGFTRFNDRYNYQIALLMFKAIHAIAPAYICDNVCFSYEVNGRNLRFYDNMTLHQPIPNYEICKRYLAYNGPTIWNALPIIIKTSSTIMQFKREYKNVFFNGLTV